MQRSGNNKKKRFAFQFYMAINLIYGKTNA
ncbi:hypothetical protein BH23PLA1_BH23PLA1_23030 [soil metagenome]